MLRAVQRLSGVKRGNHSLDFHARLDYDGAGRPILMFFSLSKQNEILRTTYVNVLNTPVSLEAGIG